MPLRRPAGWRGNWVWSSDPSGAPVRPGASCRQTFAGCKPLPPKPRKTRSRRRKPIIATLTKSIQSIPHIHICRELPADGLIALKQRARDVTYTEILLKSLALAVEEFPAFKTSLVDDQLYQPETTRLGFVVDVEDALVIPTIEDPASKPIQDLAAEVRGLTRRARQGGLQHGDVSGATVSLSNLGMHEVDLFTAVIPYGQVAVLTTGRIRYQPTIQEGSLVEVPRLWANLTVDHRLIDGVAAAKFLKTLANLLRDGSIHVARTRTRPVQAGGAFFRRRDGDRDWIRSVQGAMSGRIGSST